MKQLYKNRLKKLAEYLLTVPEKEFNMRYFKKENCQTVACACGHACNIPSFKRAGLHLELFYEYTNESIYSLMYKGDKDFDAAASFFGISIEESLELFDPDSYNVEDFREIKPEVVSSKIFKLLKNY